MRSTSEASDYACSWAVRSTEDFERRHIKESKRATQVNSRVRLQLAASLLCMTKSASKLHPRRQCRSQSAACKLRQAHPCRLACAPTFVTAATTPASSALLGVLIQQGSPAKASIASSGPRQAPSHAAHPQQSHKQRRARRPEDSGCHTAARGITDMQPLSACQPASSVSEPAESACPLCGVSVKTAALQAHVAAELDELDKAVRAATPFAGVARQHVETSALQLDTAHVKQQQQQQQPSHHMNAVPHAEKSCYGAVYTHQINALCESSSSAGNCASSAHHRRHQSARAAFQGPQHSKHACANSQTAPAKQTDENVPGSISSGAALGHGKAQNCLQHQRRQAAGMLSTARHQGGRAQWSQAQAHMRSASGRGSQQQQERRWKPHRKSGVKRNSQVTGPVWVQMQT